MLKEAEKEQETIRKAMEKARRDVDKASAEERAKYEENDIRPDERGVLDLI